MIFKEKIRYFQILAHQLIARHFSRQFLGCLASLSSYYLPKKVTFVKIGTVDPDKLVPILYSHRAASPFIKKVNGYRKSHLPRYMYFITRQDPQILYQPSEVFCGGDTKSRLGKNVFFSVNFTTSRESIKNNENKKL